MVICDPASLGPCVGPFPRVSFCICFATLQGGGDGHLFWAQPEDVRQRGRAPCSPAGWVVGTSSAAPSRPVREASVAPMPSRTQTQRSQATCPGSHSERQSQDSGQSCSSIWALENAYTAQVPSLTGSEMHLVCKNAGEGEP